MRLLLLRGTSNANSGSSRIAFASTGAGWTAGRIGTLAVGDCPPSLLATSVGTLLAATGYGPVKRLRPRERTLSNAGVPRPVSAPTITSQAGLGALPAAASTVQMTFDYTQYGSPAAIFAAGGGYHYTELGQQSLAARTADYQRFRSALGLAEGEDPPTGTGTKFFGLTPASLTPGVRAVFNWQYLRFTLTVRLPASTTSAATGHIAGRYQAFVRYVDKDGYVSDPGPISADAVLTAAPYIQYTDLPVPGDTRVVRRQVFRNTNGQSDTFYLDLDTTDLASTTLRSYLSDEQLKLALAQPLFDSDGFSLAELYGEPPYDKPFLAEFNGRVWAAGSRPYDTGHLEATNGSATVTGIGTAWNAYLAGRELVAAGASYTVVSVDADAQTAVVSPPWQGATDAYVHYAIRPYQGEANLLRFSLAGYPESWPDEHQFGLPQDDDDITGLVKFGDALYVLKERHIYRVAQGTDPLHDAQVLPAAERGCINSRCAVAVGGVLFCLDRQGIHAFTGDASPQPVSLPVADLFRQEADWLSVHWDVDACGWHAIHHEELGVIRWYITMAGSRAPQHAICLDYRRERWWVEEYPVTVTASCLAGGELLGRPVLGAEDGRLVTSDVGPLDLVGTAASTRFGVVAALSAYALQLDTAPPSLIGTPVAVVEGRGRGQVRRVAWVSDTTLEVDAPWSESPDATSVLQFGAVPYYATTARPDLEKAEVETPQAVVLRYQPTSVADPEAVVRRGELPVRVALKAHLQVTRDDDTVMENAVDAFWGALRRKLDDPSVLEVDLADQSSLAKANIDRRRELDIPKAYRLQATVLGFSGTERPRILGVHLLGVKAQG